MKRKIVLTSWLILIFPCLLAGTGEKELLATADARIQKFRTRHVILHLRDKEGQPLTGHARVEMRRHQFLFGCNLFMFEKMPGPEHNARYLQLWSALFNYATLPFYLATYQPTPAETREAELKRMARWCQENGIRAKGHPLIWHFPESVPSWLPTDPSAVAAIYKQRIQELVQKFAPEIQYWDVLNEPTVAWMYDTPVAKWENQVGPLEVSRQALEWASAANPAATLLINDYNVRTGLWSGLNLLHPLRSLQNALDPVNHYTNSFYKFLSDLKAQGGKFHAIGLQTHMHMGGNWPLPEVWRTCERYAQLGLPLHFTEVTVLSGQEKVMWPFNPELNLPWPTTEKGEARQAEYVEKFYTLLFSQPAVEAITWWDFTDHGAWMSAPAGLVRDDLSPKPAYHRLLRLVREKWWTRLEITLDETGSFSFRGFCGDYRLYLPTGNTLDFFVDCKKQDGQELFLRLPE